MKIAIIGAGNLGLSIADGIIKSNIAQSLYITKRNIDSLKQFESKNNVFITKDNKKAIENSDIIILAVQPYQIEDIIIQNKDIITDSHTLISTIAGFNLEKIENLVGKEKSIIRAMPNTAISIRKSMTCICANKKGKEKINLALDIFNHLGFAFEMQEKDMQAATVLCSSGIAFWLRMIQATAQAAVQLGIESEEARKMSAYTCIGAAQLLISKDSHPEEEIDKVTTPGGCTIAGLNEMEHEGLSSALIKGIIASYDKINQLSKN